MHTISTATVAELIEEGRADDAIAIAYVALSESFDGLPDGGDQLYTSLFTPDECRALEQVLEVAREGMAANRNQRPPATLANMRRLYRPGLVAVSETADEQCSADPADYFWMGPDDSLTDSAGQPIVLATSGR